MDYITDINAQIYNILLLVYSVFLILLQVHFGRTGNRKASASLIKVSFLISFTASAAMILYAYLYATYVLGYNLHIVGSIVAFVVALVIMNIPTIIVWVIDSYYRKKDKS